MFIYQYKMEAVIVSIGKRVREVREHNQLTHHDFSNRLKEKENRIKSVEYDKQRAPGKLLAKIVEEFQVDALWLLTGKGVM
jgi:ribosome-binding protein aMBF1 (putative translation factor)